MHAGSDQLVVQLNLHYIYRGVMEHLKLRNTPKSQGYTATV